MAEQSDDRNSEGPSVSFKKVSNLAARAANRKRRNRNRSGDRSGSSSAEETVEVQRPTKALKSNPLIQSTSSGARRRKRAESRHSNTDSEEEDRTRLLLGAVEYKSTHSSAAHPTDMGATATLEINTDFTVDSQAQFEKAQDAIKEQRGKADDKVYRGLATYGGFFDKKDSTAGKASSGFVRKGPIRAPTNIRQTVRWDYQPDLCKDYKETGFCGFGDSCKFMHDRTDYKHGWELEREWAEGSYGSRNNQDYEIRDSDENEEDEKEFPFKCFICRQSFTDPVVTKCDHYFCEKCALDHYRETPKCYICDKNTGGVFNPAKELMARIKAKAAASSTEVETSSRNDGNDHEESCSSAKEEVSTWNTISDASC